MAQERAPDYRGYIDALMHLYAWDSPENPTGKSHREWHLEDYRVMSTSNIEALRMFIATNRPEVWDFMPDWVREGRSEGEARFLFQNLLLRASEQRKEMDGLYEWFLRDALSAEYQIPTGRIDINTPITLERGVIEVSESGGVLSSSIGRTAPLTAQPEAFVARDMVVQALRNSGHPTRNGMVGVQSDLVDRVVANSGLQNQGAVVAGRLSDRALYDLAYTVAADQEITAQLPVDVTISREVYAILPELGALIGAGQDVPDDQAITAGLIAGITARQHGSTMPETMVYRPATAVSANRP